jgi:hypothetical protein
MVRPHLGTLPTLDVRPSCHSGEARTVEALGVRLDIAAPANGALVVRPGGGAPLLVQLVSTPCHYGGRRWWALCPACARRCAVLYLRASLARSFAAKLRGEPDAGWYLECRVCVGRPYASQGWGALRTLSERAQRAKKRLDLGGRAYRWRRTRKRLEAAADAAESALGRRASAHFCRGSR